MRIFAVFISIFFSVIVECLSIPTCDVSVSDKLVQNGIYSCNIKITAPSEWKFPQAPNITIKNANVFSDVMQSIKKSSPTEYVFHIAVKQTSPKNLQLSIASPICNKVCVLSNSNIDVDFGDYSLILLYMLFGFIGGLLLNVMPCVLPVILMKLRAFNSRIGIIGSICGNFTSFAIITIGLIFLKSIGSLAGWGMQFQNTGFLATATVLLLILTLQSFEIIHFRVSISSRNDSKSIFFKNFISSTVATFIAIPCTAPILGVATTFAIQGTILQLVMIFFAIATGFSFPYIFTLIFKIKPPHITGRIGQIFNQVVNFGVLITFLWVLWLLIQNITAKESDFNKVYDELQRSVSNNRIVMLNITADWCLTCKYNRKYILNNEKTKKIMKDYNVQFVEVDITKNDPAITKFLHEHNRVGIPFTIIYGAHAKDGILLNEIPSVDQIIEAIKKAK